MDNIFIGSIILNAGSYAPQGWMVCNGALLQIAQYTTLFSLLGTKYGGNGTTTFALPNLTGPGGTTYVIAVLGSFPAHGK
jgi:microcystin-dependent protein